MRKTLEVINKPLKYGTRRLMPGDTFSVPASIANVWLRTKRAIEARPREELPPPPAGLLAKFDRDGDGKIGGSLPNNPPSLSGKTKAQLIEIAQHEGLSFTGDETVAQIKAAIESRRG